MQLLTSFSSVVNMAKGLGLNVDETLNGILGTVGLSGTMLCAVPWKNHFKEVCVVVGSHRLTYRNYIRHLSSTFSKANGKELAKTEH